MAFGVKRIPLPKDDFGLDEDGWIDIRTRLTVKTAFAAASMDGKDQEASTRQLLSAYLTGWFIKAGGDELKFSPATVLDLPVEMLEVITAEIERVPLPQSLTAKL